MRCKYKIIITVLVLSSFFVTPVLAESPWIQDELNDWYDGTTGDPVEGVNWLDIRKSSITKLGYHLVFTIAYWIFKCFLKSQDLQGRYQGF